MKTINKITIISLAISFFILSSCEDLVNINRNPNAIPSNQSDPNMVMTYVLTTFATNTLSNGYLNGGQLMQYVQKDNWFGANAYEWGGSAGSSWGHYYAAYLINTKLMNERATALGWEFHQGVALVMKCMIYGQLTDLYGDVPYSKALQGGEPGATLDMLKPAYDRQQDIYTGILADLETANTLLSKPAKDYIGITPTADVYYNGDPTKWRKLCNSLLLRYYMRLSEKLPTLAKTGVEKIAGDPATYPIITSFTEDAAMPFAGNSEANSWPADTVYDGTSGSNYRRIKASRTLIESLQSKNDPRIAVWFKKVQIPLKVDAAYIPKSDSIVNGVRLMGTNAPMLVNAGGLSAIDQDPEYVGLPINESLAPSAYNLNKEAGPSSYNKHVSFLSDIYKLPTHPLLKARLLSAAEVHFILAEAALKGWATGNAKTHYEEGIKASFSNWGLDNAYAQYIAGPNVVLSATPATALAQVMEQKWISNWTNAFEAWFDYRRTGLPALKTGPVAVRTVLPVRFYYPIDEENRNTDNAFAASDLLEPTQYSTNDGLHNNSAWSKMWLLQGTGKPW